MKRKIYLPHIDYTIFIIEGGKPPTDNAIGWVVPLGEKGCEIHLTAKIKKNPLDLAHEVIHILQLICAERYMNFSLEQEHMAYLMQYIMDQILGCKWE